MFESLKCVLLILLSLSRQSPVADAEMSDASDTPPTFHDASSPTFRIVQLTDLHIFSRMDRWKWAKDVASPKNIFGPNSAWVAAGARILLTKMLEHLDEPI